ncbi:MAG: 50S ribosomal protein L35 [bacterium]|nr:50S ribosomal protein L35 [bacterium]
MRKAVLKRIKITKTGKLLHKKAGQNHFNAKMSRRSQLRKKNLVGFSKTMEKNFRNYLTN